MATSIQNKQIRRMAPIIPQLDPQARLAALRGIRGMWKNRDIKTLIREFRQIRKEWDRKHP